MAAELLNFILSKIGDYLVETTVRQVGYLVHYKRYVEDLLKEGENLRLVLDGVQQEVERARKNTEEIKKDVQQWLIDVSSALADVQKFEEEKQVNKTCLSGWCPDWGWRYRLSKKATRKKSTILKLQGSGKFSKVSHPVPLPGIGSFAPKDFMPFESTKCALDKIIESLKDDKINTVGLYGMGGVGKTTLAKVVAKKVREQKIFDEVAMAVVSQTPNLKKIQGQIADLLSLKLNEESEEGRAERLSLRLKGEKRILIILDDVWEKFDLTTIGFSFDEDCMGHKIFITTRRSQVCREMGCQVQIPLDVLNEEEGLSLFRQHASISDDCPTFNDIAIEIARECSGLPLAIAIIGSALREKDIEEWKVVSKRLKVSKPVGIENVSQELYARLKLSYDYLKDEETKLCFLLSSLFPDDYDICFETLLHYGIGLGLYQDAETIQEARSELHLILNQLKASCLMRDADREGFMIMHDMVHDVALWIASKGDNLLMAFRAVVRLTNRPKLEVLKQCRAISLTVEEIEVLPSGLTYPNLEILILEGSHNAQHMEVPNPFFDEMKRLKVLDVTYGKLSLKSLEFLTSLKTLVLNDCELRDISSLRKLEKSLEFLDLDGSSFDELPEELGELCKLRFLSLVGCHDLVRISSNVIRENSQLEELYITSKYKEWEVVRTSSERSKASLYELNSLPRLDRLFLSVYSTCLPKDFAFPKLVSYRLCVNSSYYGSYKRVLKFIDIEAPSLISFKAQFENVEYLYLEKTSGCQNILPSIDQGLNELKSLELIECNELEYVLDMTQQRMPANAFSKLVKLSLNSLLNLKEICYGESPPTGFLESLEIIDVEGCEGMCSLFTIILLPRLRRLKEVKISSCVRLPEVFQLEGLCHTGTENLMLLPSLTNLKLEALSKMICIWKGLTYHISLQSLTGVEIDGCGGLKYLFTLSLAQSLVQLKSLQVSDCRSLEHLIIEDGDDDKREKTMQSKSYLQSLFFSKLESLHIYSCERLGYIFSTFIAEGLVQLEELTITNSPQLKQVFYMGHEKEEKVTKGHGMVIKLPKLKRLNLSNLENLISFCSQDYSTAWPGLEEFEIFDCSNFSLAGVELQAIKETLRVLRIGVCKQQLCDEILACLRYGFKNLEELSITNWGVKVIFQLEGLITVGGGQQHQIWLPSLKKLSLNFLGELEGLYKGSTNVLSLQNLTFLNIAGCDKLRHIFSRALARNLPQLEHLAIIDCIELEKIIVEEDEGDQVLLNHHLQRQLLSNLSSIEVYGCHKLRCLFAITDSRYLHKLERLHIFNSFELEEVFGHKDGEDVTVMDDKQIVLPQLSKLSLQFLPNLTNFCPVDYHFIFPSLNSLLISQCPKTNTRFSLAENNSVHAQAKAPPREGKEDEKAQFPPEPAGEIRCWSTEMLRERLPPYTENI